jgi:hypothetical protein
MSEQEIDATSTDTEVQDTETETAAAETTAGESDLGDAGKKVLEKVRLEKKQAIADARAALARAEAAEAALAAKDKPAEEVALDAARAEARTEANKKANERILRADLRAAATGKLADPSNAALYINLADFTVSDDGETDSDAIDEAITDLIARKPHLAAQKQSRFEGSADQGAKGKDSAPQQLSKEDLSRMSPEEIAAADAAGQLNQLKGVKS